METEVTYLDVMAELDASHQAARARLRDVNGAEGERVFHAAQTIDAMRHWLRSADFLARVRARRRSPLLLGRLG